MENEKNRSALHELHGIDAPQPINAASAEQFKKFRRKPLQAHEIATKLLEGDVTALSRAITLVESNNPEHLSAATQIISRCLPQSGNSIRIGITGVPGVGKSTFIEAFGKHLTRLGKKVAVLAVDPSSSISHGSILGDKTRMEELVKDAHAYIRPSASGETLGGVARKTRETITLCEAAGFDIVIIETVGVGQSETAVHGMTDFFLLLKISGAGDELQGIKRGIMEMADAIVINKADGDNIKRARLAKTEFSRALHLFPPKGSGWQPKVTTCSAITKDGVGEVWEMILKFLELTKDNGAFVHRRSEQDEKWLTDAVDSELKTNFYNHPEMQRLIDEKKQQVRLRQLSPFAAAQELLKVYYSSYR